MNVLDKLHMANLAHERAGNALRAGDRELFLREFEAVVLWMYHRCITTNPSYHYNYPA
mgnify:CR=1 FL=1